MELLNKEEVISVVESYGFKESKVLNWSIESYSENLIGYLGDHLRLIVTVESEKRKSELRFFVKCMPRFDKWKADYLKELCFFKKEYIMLSTLFKDFEFDEGSSKWRPKLLYVREELFVFEDVAELGYSMPSHLNTLTYDEIKATVQTLAKFHAQSYLYEERKSKQLNRPYKIWDDYSEYLQEPQNNLDWRNCGRNAVVDFLKVYSAYKSKPNFSKCLEILVPKLFDSAFELMKPSSDYRNVVIHRDLWANNIFFKKDDNATLHTLIVDFQTVLYCSPMLDLSSLIFFNTTRMFRNNYTNEIINFYYKVLSDELKAKDVNISKFFDKTALIKAYDESVTFAITQASLIVPIIAMSSAKREQLFSNPETGKKVNVVSRSVEFIEIAKDDDVYLNRVTELFDEIVERYMYPPEV